MNSTVKNNNPLYAIALTCTALAAAQTVTAGEIVDTFAADQTLTADMMNNIKNAVNDNNTRLGSITDELNTAKADLDALKGNATCAGNNGEDVMIRVGPICVDKYEASLWSDTSDTATTTSAGDCGPDGGNCTYVAQSRAVTTPAAEITFLQATAACANAGKRLLTPGEYQMAALGTPAASCNTSTEALATSGEFSGCISRDHGNEGRVNDMIGNVYEFVDAIVTSNGGIPQASYMGSSFSTGPTADAQRFYSNVSLLTTSTRIGFRCAR